MTMQQICHEEHQFRFAATSLAVTAALVLVGGCGAGEQAPPAPAEVPASAGTVVDQAAFRTESDPICRWVPADRETGHQPPQDSSGPFEVKMCGAPAGDTTGMGGPVEWRSVDPDGTS